VPGARIHKDPLVPLALAYFYDATTQRGSIAEMMNDIADHGGQIAVDVSGGHP